MIQNKKGFTLVEILIIVIIIGILVSVVLVSLINAKNKSQDNSVFTSFKSAVPAVFTCLTSGSPGVQLFDLQNNAGQSICTDPLATGDARWPDFSKYGWSNEKNGDPGFYWCRLGSTGPGPLISTSPVYVNGNFGGMRITGNFCIMLKKDSKYIWCTEEGCKKEGF